MAQINYAEAVELGLVPRRVEDAINEYYAGQGRYPSGFPRSMGTLPFYRIPSVFQRPSAMGSRPGISPLRFGLGPLGQGLGLSPSPSAVSGGGVPVGRRVEARRGPADVGTLLARSEPQDIAQIQRMIEAGLVSPAMLAALMQSGRVPRPAAALRSSASGGDAAATALSLSKRGLGVAKEAEAFSRGEGLAHDVLTELGIIDPPGSPPRSEEAFQLFRAGERNLPQGTPFVDPRAVLPTSMDTGAAVPDVGVTGGSFSELPGGIEPGPIIDPAILSSPSYQALLSPSGGGGAGVAPLPAIPTDVTAGVEAGSEGADIAAASPFADAAPRFLEGAGVAGDLAGLGMNISRGDVGSSLLTGAKLAMKTAPRLAEFFTAAAPAGAELGMGIGATLPAVEGAGVGLSSALNWAALPLSIFAASGAFGDTIQRLMGFGNQEQAKNQAHEARVLSRDLAVAGPQAAGGQRAAFDLGSLGELPENERAKRLQELEHTLLTGYNAAPVFSRAGGPDRGTQDIDTLIGLVRARDAMARLGIPSLRGKEGIPALEPEHWLTRLGSYATAAEQPRLNLRSGGPEPAGAQTPSGYEENANYDPTGTYFETLFPTPGRARTGYGEDASGNPYPVYNMPSNIETAFPSGEFEARALALLRRLSPSFDQSLLAERLRAVPTIPDAAPPIPPEEGGPPSMQTGGVVPRTGPYTLHEGEEVVPRDIADALRRGLVQPEEWQEPMYEQRIAGIAGREPLSREALAQRGVTGMQEQVILPKDRMRTYMDSRPGGGAMFEAKDNPDPAYHWRLATSAQEVREALDERDPVIAVAPDVLTLPIHQAAPMIERARVAQYEQPGGGIELLNAMARGGSPAFALMGAEGE